MHPVTRTPPPDRIGGRRWSSHGRGHARFPFGSALSLAVDPNLTPCCPFRALDRLARYSSFGIPREELRQTRSICCGDNEASCCRKGATRPRRGPPPADSG